MKKIFLSLIILFLVLPFVWAVPADPTPYKYIQPDGTAIVLQNHGDEFFHWTTDMSGQTVEMGPDGFYRPVTLDFSAMAAQAAQKRRMNRTWSSYDNPPATNFGDRKVLCLLANFSDITYSVENPNEHFTNMLNEPGYNLNGSTGSVRDYYLDNSWNGTESLYRPEFDVYGPVTLSNPESYYDANGVYLAIEEAYNLMSDQINIADYDTDDDGILDMVLFYFPGYNQAEGAESWTIWPHQGTAYPGYCELGDKILRRYFCTSELKGNSDNNPDCIPASIGTTCHEFAHSLGLPDFYDTDYEESGGENGATGPYDLMASGSYNNNGCTPPYMSAVERNMLGWMDYPEPLVASGNYSLEGVQNNKAYRLESEIANEYFILETRNGGKWDAPLPRGMLIYHVDKTDRIVGDGYTAAELWESTNKINAYGGHPCYDLDPSGDAFENWNLMPLPGTNNVTQKVPRDWNGNSIPSRLTNIAYAGGVVSFTLTMFTARTVTGTVTDMYGHPIEGAQVSLTQSITPFAAAPSLLSGSIFTTTDAEGHYSLELDNEASNYQILMVEKEGFVSECENLNLTSLYTIQNIALLRKGELPPADLFKYDSNLSFYNISLGYGDLAAGMHYTAEELSSMNAVGAQLKNIHFMGNIDKADVSAIYVLVDIGDVISLRREVTAQYVRGSFMSIDISDAGIVIPEGKDMYIGYGFTGIPENTEEKKYYPFKAFGLTEDSEGCYVIPDFLGSDDWQHVSFGSEQPKYMSFAVAATIAPAKDVVFSDLGVSYIQVEAGVPTLKLAAGKSLKSTAWYLDGVLVEGELTPVADLSAGSHTYMARLSYYDGTSERVFFDVDVD